MNKKYFLFVIIFYCNVDYAQPISIPKQYVYPGIPLDKNQRSSSYPYITGDTIRAHCDWIIDETMDTCDPELIRDGDTIFLNANWCAFFFEKVHPRINARYILVTHNSVFHAPGKYERYLDDATLVAWFAKNTMIVHPKMHSLPLGMANNYWPHGDTGTMDDIRNQLSDLKKDILLYLNFDIKTNPMRVDIYNYFKEQSFSYMEQPKPFKDYLHDLARSRFVISPPGSSLDCHRIWEALLVQCIPIVLHSPLDLLLHDLPVLIINDWTEVTEEFLNQQYAAMQSIVYNQEKLFAHYWIDQITSLQQTIRT